MTTQNIIAQPESDLDFSVTSYLLTYFTLQQIRHELFQAERKAGFPFCDHDTQLEKYYRQFGGCCREALDIIRGQTPIYHSPRGQRHASIEDIKSRYDLVGYIGQYTALRRSGSRFIGLCPLHADKKTTSLVVYADSQTWHCFGACNTGGDIISFVMKLHSVDVKGAIALLDCAR